MKFRSWGQNLLATAGCAGLGLALTSCGASNTVDYLYLLSSRNNPGQVNVLRVDGQTGALTQIPNSPYPAGRNPVGIVIAPSGKNLYVINHDDNTIIDYGIGTDAKLYAQHTYTTPGTEPVAIGMNAAGTFLFVIDHYAPLYTDLNPGPGAIILYAIEADGELSSGAANGSQIGAPVPQALPTTGATVNYYPLGASPSAVTILPSGNTAYITEQLAADAVGCSTGQGAIVALSVDSSGVLTPVTGSPFCAGSTPSAITSRPAGDFLYVTDSTANQLLTFGVNGDGSVASVPAATLGTGTFPDALTFDATGAFLYVANRNSNNLQSFTVAAGTGLPTVTGSYATQPYPQCVIVDPNLNSFVYTADFQGAGSTGYKIDPSTGALRVTENSPYGGSGQATCLAATVHNKTGGSKGSA